MRGQCKSYCKQKDFATQILYNNSITTYWKSDANKYVSTLNTDANGKAKRCRRYTSKHKALGLAKCKTCVYITAQPTRPGTICKCCNRKLSQSIRDIDQTARAQHIRRHEQPTNHSPTTIRERI